jgi:hypothetical protein
MPKPKKINLSQLGEATANKEDFQGHNTRGGRFVSGTGLLPDDHAKAFSSDNPNYVVRHHATPIAWHGDRGWVVPPVKYSSTTSRRQNAIRRSLGDHFTSSHDAARY